jgi:plasmid rolling circle replication initiator protein Rep
MIDFDNMSKTKPMRMRATRPKTAKLLRLDPDIALRLERYSHRARISQTAIVQAALKEFLPTK